MSSNSQTRHLICSGRMILIKGHPRGQATNQMDEWGVGESTVSVGTLRRIFDNCWEEWVCAETNHSGKTCEGQPSSVPQ
ncbi:hypothetical protein TNCT_734361 [Trichonephila clavata]|uniref:Uncharacterized protein n=1 Tax=Trichonephila clavata TaxID=2740835 RepID=A0A8X6GXB2_TRICU|nr:hypothetical protein TNCT_734361 [Trichonephila clavata]